MNFFNPALLTADGNVEEARRERSQMLRVLGILWLRDFSSFCSFESWTEENDSHWPCLKIHFVRQRVKIEICLTCDRIENYISYPSDAPNRPFGVFSIYRRFDEQQANYETLYQLLLDTMRERGLISALGMIASWEDQRA